jgi:ATP-dependent RNA helicase DDX51/DBP6
LQGLDQALLDAEIVDPASLQSIKDVGEEDQTGLSEKMRKRLKELGITELFAGMHVLSPESSSALFNRWSNAVQTALLPFLLPSDRSQRGLYRPYDPPCDACVSAPTGSGKTLAYVLPIIEVQALYKFH